MEVFSDRYEVKGVDGNYSYTEDVIDAGNSGIVLRFCSAVGALYSRPVVITGDHSIRHRRPMQPLLSGLSQLGVQVSSMRGDGFAPILIQGPMRPGKLRLEGQDSQPVSALLIAACFAEGPIQLEVKSPGELPWVALTLEWLERLGILYENRDFKAFQLFGNASYEGFAYTVPGDLSSAAFPLGAALVTRSELKIKNVDLADAQGDKELIFLLQKMGAKIELDRDAHTLVVKKGGKLSGAVVDINACIDALPLLAVVACFAEGTTQIKNAAVARDKECDRLRCITQELRKMGALIEETKEGLEIQGSPLRGASLFSHHDHRMVMALAVGALGAQGDSCISEVSCVQKTYPSFVRDFNQLGAAIIEERE